MTYRLRRLNDEGVRRFAEYLAGGADGPAPVDLLDNPETSDALPVPVIVGSGIFDSRFDFGVHRQTLFKYDDAAVIGSDRNLWTSLALYWFDHLCPPKPGGRDVGEEYRYILSSDYRHYYRHLDARPGTLCTCMVKIRASCWSLHASRTTRSVFMARSWNSSAVASRFSQAAASSAAANRMYLDPRTNRPRTGVAGSGRGSARRFGIVLRQFDLTYDPEAMPDGGLTEVLPGAIQKWKPAPAQGQAVNANRTDSQATRAAKA